MAQAVEEFKDYYIKSFVKTNRTAEELMPSVENLPVEDEAYENTVVRGYVLLSTCKPKYITHLKILTSYEKIMKKNREAGMETTIKEFTRILYILHRYCVRLLKFPWRKEFFTIKAHTGFYQYSLKMYLIPSVIRDLLQFIGFEFDPGPNAFSLKWPHLDEAAVQVITDAGVGFFLAFIYCRARNDPTFKEKVKSLTHLLHPKQRREERSPRSMIERSRTSSSRRSQGPTTFHERRRLVDETSGPRSAEMQDVDLPSTFDRSNLYQSATFRGPMSSSETRSGNYSRHYEGNTGDLYAASSGSNGSHVGQSYGTDRKRNLATAQHYSSALYDQMENIGFDDRPSPSRQRGDKGTSYKYQDKPSERNFDQLYQPDPPAVGKRGSPDGEMDMDRYNDFGRRSSVTSDRIHHQIK